jgi:hypothetical protein
MSRYEHLPILEVIGMRERVVRRTMLVLVSGVLLLFCSTGYGENIDPLNDDSQYAYGENVGWCNFEPIEGWQANIGWINLSPTTFGGVINDGFGNLAGYAWSENAGWISFSCTNNASCATVDYGVTIDSNGDFNGWGYGENIGWIHFNSTSPVPYKVQTAWTPIVFGDLDCNGRFDGTDVLIQASLVVDLISCERDLIGFPCINTCPDDVLARSDWDCMGTIDGTDVLIGASIVVDIITEADTPLGQGCPPEE